MTTPPFELYRLEKKLTREDLVDSLANVPARLESLALSLDPGRLERRPANGEWAPIEICRHMRDAVQVYGMRFKWMILDDAPLLPNYDENRWVAESPDGPEDLRAILHEVSTYRSETIRLLRSLSAAGWSRTGRHELLGTVELEPYVQHQLVHEEQHLSQLQQAGAARGHD